MISVETFQNMPNEKKLVLMVDGLRLKLKDVVTEAVFSCSAIDGELPVWRDFIERNFQPVLQELLRPNSIVNLEEIKHLYHKDHNGVVYMLGSERSELFDFIRYYLGYSLSIKPVVEGKVTLHMVKRKVEGRLFNREELLKRSDLLNFTENHFSEITREYSKDKDALGFFKKTTNPKGEYFVFKAHSGLFTLEKAQT